MRAVFRHELSSYFTSVSAYVLGAFILLFSGIYTMVYNLNAGYTAFEYVLGAMSFIFLIIVPILTMRVIAEERKQKTDQLLYSLPLSMTQVVLGKYAALLVVFLVPLIITGIYPLILSAYGNVNLATSYGAIVGFFLLGAALISIGMFISSVTESQAVAAGLCFVVMLVNYFVSDLAAYVSTTAFASLVACTITIILVALIVQIMTKNSTASILVGLLLEAALLIYYVINSAAFEGLFSEIMESLSLFERFYGFVDGVFDLTSVVYFLSVIGLFLYLSVESMEKRRWSE